MSKQIGKLRSSTGLERLEQRTLMSGWTTVEDYQSPAGPAYYFDIAADSGGNLYAAGTEAGHRIVREKVAGGSSWSTIYSSPDATGGLSELAVNAAGDVYAAGSNAAGPIVLRRAAGQSTFSTIYTGPSGDIRDIAIDSAGDVFTVGVVNVTTVVHKTSTTATYWAVRKQTAGQGTFATVDQFLYSSGASSIAFGVSIVESGPSAGIYVVGEGSSTTQPTAALVRKSTNGGSSWTTVDTFRDQGLHSTGEAITADAAGNIYVAGQGNRSILTRKSTNGGPFAIVDSMPFEPNTVKVPYAMVTDHSDNVYVVGMYIPHSATGSALSHGYIRSNVGGTWATVDDYFESSPGGYYRGVTIDPAGSVLVAGVSLTPWPTPHGIVRSNAQPAATTFSRQPIASVTKWSLFHADDSQLDELIV